MGYPAKYDTRLRVGKTAGVSHAPVAMNSFVLGPYANAAMERQHIVEFKTRLNVNANIKPVQHGAKNIATKPISMAGIRTRLTTPLTNTGSLGKPSTATASLMTGRSN